MRGDLGILIAYSAIVCGIAVVSGRPLSLHEAVLPQTARSMFADHDFVVPKIDAKRPGTVEATMPPAPWLENPPLPQWCTVAVASLFGRCDSEAIVRLGPTLVSIGAVLSVAWIGALWFGRGIGVLCGLAMATTLEFTRYSWSSEDEIYLCGVMAAVMALFVKNEFALANEGWTSQSADAASAARPGSSALRQAFVVAVGVLRRARRHEPRQRALVRCRDGRGADRGLFARDPRLPPDRQVRLGVGRFGLYGRDVRLADRHLCPLSRRDRPLVLRPRRAGERKLHGHERSTLVLPGEFALDVRPVDGPRPVRTQGNLEALLERVGLAREISLVLGVCRADRLFDSRGQASPLSAARSFAVGDFRDSGSR